MVYLGDFPTGATVYVPFHTFDSSGASVTLTGLAVTDLEVYKDGSATQRASDSGYALLDTDGIDFDSITGIHAFSIDLSDNTDSGFFAAGSDYWIVVSSVTVDGQTVNFVAATFSIENRVAGSLGAQAKLDVNAEADTALTDYDPPTKAELDSGFAALNDPTAAAIADAVADEVLTAGSHDVADSLGQRIRLLHDADSPAKATVSDVSPSASGFDTDLSDADGFWDDALFVFIDGALAGQSRPISSYLQTSGAVTFDEPFSSAPSNGDGFVIRSDHIHPVSQIADAIADEPLAGHTTAGSLGKAIADIETDAAAILDDTGTTLQAELDGIQADTEDIQSRLPAALTGDGNIKSDLLRINGDANAAARLALSAAQMIPGTVNDAITTPTTTAFAAIDITEATADHYNGRLVLWTSGALTGQVTDVTDYALTSGEGVFTVTAMTEAPADGDTFLLV